MESIISCGKDDGNYGFKSDHIINGSNKPFIMLSIMFNAMLTGQVGLGVGSCPSNRTTAGSPPK